jgi:hypothetical protein
MAQVAGALADEFTGCFQLPAVNYRHCLPVTQPCLPGHIDVMGLLPPAKQG